jgi:hypothetical protein
VFPARIFLGEQSLFCGAKECFTFSAAGRRSEPRPATLPEVVTGDFSGFVIDQDSFHLRAVKRYDPGGERLTVISNLPVTPELLQRATSRVGSVTLFPPGREGDVQVPPPAKASLSARAPVDAGRVPSPSNRFDPTLGGLPYSTQLIGRPGNQQTGAVGVITRPSKLTLHCSPR